MNSDAEPVASELVHEIDLELPDEVKLSDYLTWKTAMLLIFAMIVLVAYSWMNGLTLDEIWFVLKNVDLRILMLALLVGYSFPLVEALAWRQILQLVDIEITVVEGYHLFITTFMFGMLVPTVGAVETATRVKLTADLTKKSPGTILSTIVMHRFLGLIAFIPMLPLLIYGLVLFLGVDITLGIQLVILVMMMAATWVLFMVIIGWKVEAAMNLAIFVIKPFTWLPFVDGPSLEEKTRSFIHEFAIDLAFLLKKPTKFVQALFWTVCSVLIRWTATYLLLISAGIHGPYLALASVNFLAGTIDLIPLPIPGMEGLREIGISEMLQLFGANPTQSFATAVLMSIFRFYFTVLLGLIFFLNLKRLIVRNNRENHVISSSAPSSVMESA